MKKEVSDLRGESATESRTKKITNTIVQSNPNGINKNKNLPGIIQTVPFSLTKKKSKKKKKSNPKTTPFQPNSKISNQ